MKTKTILLLCLALGLSSCETLFGTKSAGQVSVVHKTTTPEGITSETTTTTPYVSPQEQAHADGMVQLFSRE